MSVSTALQNLVVLVADANMEFAVRGILARRQSLEIRPITYEIRVHPGHDSGCRTGSASFLASFSARFEHARPPDGAPNPCLGARDCGECTSRTPCGWCDGSCLAGDANGSWDLTCSGDRWLYRGVQCPGSGTQCTTHTDCLSCASGENSCGWCANTHSCVTGEAVGPAESVAGCAAASGTWIYNTTQQTCP